jgi:sorbitol-specific phosphotransferase system component IIBC
VKVLKKFQITLSVLLVTTLSYGVVTMTSAENKTTTFIPAESFINEEKETKPIVGMNEDFLKLTDWKVYKDFIAWSAEKDQSIIKTYTWHVECKDKETELVNQVKVKEGKVVAVIENVEIYASDNACFYK